MSNQLFGFVNKFYKYGQNNEPDERPLTIGGYESSWLADLVVNFILDNLQRIFLSQQGITVYTVMMALYFFMANGTMKN